MFNVLIFSPNELIPNFSNDSISPLFLIIFTQDVCISCNTIGLCVAIIQIPLFFVIISINALVYYFIIDGCKNNSGSSTKTNVFSLTFNNKEVRDKSTIF